MIWIDGPRWAATPGRRLVKLLATLYTSEQAMIKALDDAGLSRELLPEHLPLGLRWHELATKLQAARRLGALLVVVRADFPALEQQLDEISEEEVATAAGNPDDAFEVRLVGPGRRPLIDRAELRSNVEQMLESGFPVLVVRGPPRCGKSFSFELVKHVTAPLAETRLIWVDFSSVASGSSAAALMAMIYRRLGLGALPASEPLTTSVRSATELVDDLVGSYGRLTPIPRIVVVDGLNRPGLDPDVDLLAAQLVKEVIHGQLPMTKLILTGFGGDLDPELRFDVLTEDVATITEAHVRLYFETLVTEPRLTTERLDELVREAMTGVGDLETLGNRVRELALPLVGR